ncbi:MAG: hypothetical protein ACKO1Y_09680 [Actinomycetota bacterium]
MPFRVPPAAVEPMLAALIGAIDVDGGPTAEQRRVLAAIAEHVWGRTGFDPDAVVALDPQGAAQALGDPLLRRRFHEVVIALEVCRHPLTATQVERVEAYCTAMGLDGPDLGMLRDLVSRGTERAAADFHRFLDANLADRVEPTLAGVESSDPEPELAARLAAFATLPAGSLGRAYLDFYERHHLSIPGVEGSPMNHFFVSHDMTHVIAGIEPTGAGEVALSAFQMGMDDNDVNASALLASLVVHEAGFAAPPSVKAEERILDEPGAADLLARELARGSRCTADFSLVDHLAITGESLGDIRAGFGVEPPADPSDGHHCW